MNHLLYILFSLLLLSCSFAHSEKAKTENKEPKKNITGIWVHKYSKFNTGPEYAADERPFPEPPFNTFLVKDSTIDFFNYPYEFLYSFNYKRNGNKITILNDKHNFLKNYHFLLVDSLIHFSNKTIFHENEKDWLELIEKYERDSVDFSTLQVLKKDTIHYKLLAGSWALNTSFSAEDGSDPIELIFPLKFPHKLSFPISQMDTAANKQLVQLKIEGKNKWFKIRFRSQYSVEMIPYGWKLEDCPAIVYYQMD
jgi:hypothetical protein